GVAGFGIAVAVVFAAGHEDGADVLGPGGGIELLDERGGSGDVGGGEAGAILSDEAAAELGHGDVDAGGEEIELVAALRPGGDDVAGIGGADGEDAGIGGGPGDPVLADRAGERIVAVAAGGDDEDPFVVEGFELVAELHVGLGIGVVAG